MGLFQHQKKKKGQQSFRLHRLSLPRLEPDAASEGRASCMNRLESVLGAPSSKGVV